MLILPTKPEIDTPEQLIKDIANINTQFNEKCPLCGHIGTMEINPDCPILRARALCFKNNWLC